MNLKDYITESLHYWEPRRIIYNFVLVAITLYYVIPFALEHRHPQFQWSTALVFLFALGVVANILYCAAYPVDIFIQFSDFRNTWLRFRGVLFLIGLALAGALTWFWAASLFDPLSRW